MSTLATGTPTPTTTTAAPTTTTAAPTTTPTPGAQPLVTRSGRQLLVGGQPFKFVGLNLDAIFGCWAGERERTTDANLNRYFRELAPAASPASGPTAATPPRSTSSAGPWPPPSATAST